jgi:hypothetical protein
MVIDHLPACVSSQDAPLRPDRHAVARPVAIQGNFDGRDHRYRIARRN